MAAAGEAEHRHARRYVQQHARRRNSRHGSGGQPHGGPVKTRVDHKGGMTVEGGLLLRGEA